MPPSTTQSSSQLQPSSSHVRSRTISSVTQSIQPSQHRHPNIRSNTYDVPSDPAMPRSHSPASFIPRPDTRESSYRSDSSDSHSRQSEYVSAYSHPYANPDLSAYNRESIHPKLDLYRSTQTKDMTLAESSTTLHDTVTTISSPSSRRGSVATVAISPDTSLGSTGNSSGDIASLKRSMGVVQGKTISGPIPVDGHTLRQVASISSIASRSRGDASFQPPINPLARWNDLPASPTFTLISLEQAQAQAKARSVTATGAPSSSANTFLDSEPPLRVSQKASGAGHRGRTRSTSAGVKAKNALQNSTAPSAVLPFEAEDEGTTTAFPRPPPLKHKKSGFMRLFNGKEKERSTGPPSPPPPVPPLHDASPVAPVPMRTHKLSVSRVPVPSITPPPPPPHGSDSDEPHTAKATDAASPTTRGRRQFPPLTIVPPNEAPARVPSLSPNLAELSKLDNHSRTTLRPEPSQTRGGLAPLSAPPGTTGFPSLSLRPVSTVFSAHFAEHMVDGDFPNYSDPDSRPCSRPVHNASFLASITGPITVDRRMSRNKTATSTRRAIFPGCALPSP